MNFKSLIILSSIILASAAKVLAFSISGTIVDAEGQPMPDASVRILKSDSSYVKGGAANLDGKYLFSGFSDGKYIVEASYVGYSKACTDVSISDKDCVVPPIKLVEASHLLKETVVTAVKTPIKVMEDTVEYNADSYKTQPNAVVEDLLKRLPGVEVGTDGSITAHGKTVSKILVDGKEFFADDPKVASKNLPVNMIDKLQVVDRKSDFARMTGVDDGDDETVINLTVKKGMKNGWFGNAELGYGTDDRYKGNFMVNRFFNENQLTFLGNFNNINELGFTDGNSGRFRRFGGDNGITDSQSFGVNFNVGRGEIFRVGGDVMYSHSDKHTNMRRNRQYLLETDPYTQNSLSDTRDRGHNLRADFRMEWKPDSFNTIDFRPNFSFNKNNSVSDAFSVATGKNLSQNLSSSRGTSYEFGGRLIYNHNFRSRKGRSLSFSGDYRMSNVREYEDSYAYNLFYQFNDSVDTYDQYIDNHTWANTVNGRVTWTEPLGDPSRGNFLTASYQVNYKWNNADKLVYDRPISFADSYYIYDIDGERYQLPMPIIDNQITQFVDTLSNRFRNKNFRQELRLGYRKVTRKLNLNVGVAVMPISSQSTNLINSAKNIPRRSNLYFSPFVRLRYKFAKQSSIQANYQSRAQEPSMSRLQPVADYSNPLNVKVGNPSLATTFTHRIVLRQQHFDQDHQRSIMSMVSASIAQNSVVSKTTYDMLTGGRVTTYENVNGVWSANVMNMFSQPLPNKVFTISNNFFYSYNRQVGFNATRAATQRNVARSHSLRESFSIAFRPNSLEIELRPNYSLQYISNSVEGLTTSTTHNYGANFYATWYSPVGIILQSDLNYTALRGYAAGYNDDTWMWNASISYRFLKDNAVVQVKAYDLLRQKSNISRTISATSIDNTEYNSLTRYFMLSFSYKFNTFGKGNEPSNRNSSRGYGGNRPPHGGGGMMPPTRR